MKAALICAIVLGATAKGIHQAILEGHAYVKFFSSDGPDLRFEASPQDKPNKTAIMGDKLKASTADFTARVLGAFGGQPRTLLVLRDGVVVLSVPVTSNDLSFEFPVTVPGNYRLQLQRGSAIEALTNPITLEVPSVGAFAL